MSQGQAIRYDREVKGEQIYWIVNGLAGTKVLFTLLNAMWWLLKVNL